MKGSKKGVLNLSAVIGRSLPTKEEFEKIREENYLFNQANPNNFSFWHEKLAGHLGGTFKVPDSVCVEMPMKIKELFEKDYSFVTEDDKVQFKTFIEESPSIKSFLAGKSELFIKTGVFSNKFNFDEACHVTDVKKLYDHVFSIMYMAAMYGANYTNELVLREYIGDVDDKPTIYNGMPLRTEFRVFYDFDKDELIGFANYWNPTEMLTNLLPYDIKNALGDEVNSMSLEKKIEVTKAALKANPSEQILYSNFINYAEYLPTLLSEYDEWKKIVGAKVKQSLKGSSVLDGQWSIDIMKNGDDFYFIDAAIMQQSALVPYIEYQN